MADPVQVSASVRHIASKLSAEVKADPERLRRSLELVLDRIAGIDTMDVAAKKIATAMVRVALEEVDVSLWTSDDGTAVDAAYNEAKKQEEAEPLETALKLLRRKVDRFINEIRNPSSEHGDDSGVVTSAPPAP